MGTQLPLKAAAFPKVKMLHSLTFLLLCRRNCLAMHIVKCAVGAGGREAVVAERRHWLGPFHFHIPRHCCHRTGLQARHSSASKSGHRCSSGMDQDPHWARSLHYQCRCTQLRAWHGGRGGDLKMGNP